MSSATILAKVKRFLGGNDFGLSDSDIYEYISESKDRLEENTSITKLTGVAIINTASQKTFDLEDSAVINLTNSNCLTLDLLDLYWDDNSPMEKKSYQYIKTARQYNDYSDEPLIYAVHQESAKLTLEVYPSIATAYSDFSTARLFADIKQLTPSISTSVEPITPAYADMAIALGAAADISEIFLPLATADLRRRERKATNRTRHRSNKESSRDAVAGIAQ